MTTYERFIARLREIYLLSATSSVLNWDMETHMPPKGVAGRSEQLTFLSGLAHDYLTRPDLGEWLAELRATNHLDDVQITNIREMGRIYDRAVKVPKRLIEEVTRTTSLGNRAWMKARKENNFPEFAPHLEKIIALQKEVAEYVGYQKSPYDALLDEYEPGLTTQAVREMFRPLRDGIVPLLRDVTESPAKPDLSLMKRRVPIEKQKTFARFAAEKIGFDFESGRMDDSTHPFCTAFNPHDVRMTNRYKEDEPMSSFTGIMHETGHGLYNQGLNAEYAYQPAGRAVSLGVHESQSRTWENMVGRSRPFWEFFFPKLQEHYAGIYDDANLDTFHFAMNAVHPSLIRVEADELTYNLHILVRFELEDALINGSLSVNDLPGAWNDTMDATLGLRPDTDAHGVLQDIHWSWGAFGYFPTYTIGNLFAAQLFAKLRADIPTLDRQIAGGEFGELLGWLRKNIHEHGMRYEPATLIENVTGEPPSGRYFVDYMQSKFSTLYRL